MEDKGAGTPRTCDHCEAVAVAQNGAGIAWCYTHLPPEWRPLFDPSLWDATDPANAAYIGLEDVNL